MKLKNLLLSCLLFVMLANCATVLKGSKEKVFFDSNPPGAELFINNKYAGKTPIGLKLKSSQEYAIRFQKEGYQDYHVQLDNHVGVGWVIIDIPLYLIPLLIDAATGAWYYLDYTKFNANLTLLKKSPEAKKDEQAKDQSEIPDLDLYLKEQQQKFNSSSSSLWDWLHQHSINSKLISEKKETGSHETK